MAAKNPPAPLGTLGNYDLEEVIGEGSMGTVYKARHWESKEVVAIKKMPEAMTRNPVLIRRFEQEYRIASRLDHPNIVRMLGYSTENGIPFIVMELVEGESLGDKLQREDRLDEEEALRIILQVSHGLHRAHTQGLIHRDVKPDNILLPRDGKAKLADLGLAKDVDAEAELTRTGGGLGTPNYMAPEQFRNAKNASVRCDIYSLGATLYQTVTGKLPFGTGNPVQIMQRKLANDLVPARTLVPALSTRTDWAIRRAMSADPEQRPPSCREFVEDLLGQSTRSAQSQSAEPGEGWYAVYTDANGAPQQTKGGFDEVRGTLQKLAQAERNLARVARSPAGPFELLHHKPEFRDLVVGPAPGPALSAMTQIKLRKLSTADVARGIAIAGGTRTPPAVSQPLADATGHAAAGRRTDLTPTRVLLPEIGPAAGQKPHEPYELLKTGVLLLLITTASVLAGMYWLSR